MAIHPYNPKTDTEWGKGVYKVMIKAHGAERPFGFCDGTAEDEAQILLQAENEGLMDVELSKRPIKGGVREIWTLKGEGGQEGE
jgi:hypothetical protein